MALIIPPKEIIDNDIRFEPLMRLRYLSRQYKKYLQDHTTGIPWDEVQKLCTDLQPELLEHAKMLSELDIEATEYVDSSAPCYNPCWWRMKKDTTWRGYWMNASGIDLDHWIGWIIRAMKYPDEGSVSEQFRSSWPSINLVPYSIKLAEVDYEKFFKDNI